ncbi:bifunctional methyltransferase/pyrophosphohydrolase YabN [Halobacillus amylolyticus]|uniref:Nucleoside triphosphate pyrophosphohydrolase n=1 Tax=Halobacillus amylolyticus TaxID=2932259 RepID=A0ABY4H7L8_9BACI|nr:nucleoside triphosphate pyrophosphohydrolase [Halobacillus amylolyticus]UOR10682.1 nucleoside triphosphate pyrophosphohydrolase [Halobacillus amylolyticus]
MNTVTILGLGAGELDQLPLGVYRQLINANEPIFIRTLDHPVIKELKAEGVDFTGFDFVYQRHDQFSQVYEEIVEQLVDTAKEKDIIYVVPGHPMLAEQTVQLLLKETRVNVSIQGGQSYLDNVFTAIGVDPIEGLQFLDATALTRSQLQLQNHILLCQVYDQMIASEVKLTLMEDLSPEYPVTIVTAAGSSEERIITVSLEELDRAVEVNNLTSVYIPPVEKDELNHQFFRLREVIRKLRGPGGCPWDQKQTHSSLRRHLIEEAYEFIDAVNQLDDDHMVEELGDVLLQVMLHSQIGEDEGFFTIDDVIVSITEKMIRRHPHVFGNVHVDNADEVVTNWDQIKKQEKKQVLESMLDDIPMSFPALLQAEELQKKAAKVGFDWDDVKLVEAKVQEEWNEFIEAKEANNVDEMEKEFGDWLFAIANLARHHKINGETALNRTNQKFRTRFSAMEKSASEEKRSLENYTLDELEVLWIAAKVKHKGEE